jgi:hypothetical protein
MANNIWASHSKSEIIKKFLLSKRYERINKYKTRRLDIMKSCAILFHALRTAAGFGDGIRKKDTEIPHKRAFI